jgi:hypothetical protein
MAALPPDILTSAASPRMALNKMSAVGRPMIHGCLGVASYERTKKKRSSDVYIRVAHLKGFVKR